MVTRIFQLHASPLIILSRSGGYDPYVNKNILYEKVWWHIGLSLPPINFLVENVSIYLLNINSYMELANA